MLKIERTGQERFGGQQVRVEVPEGTMYVMLMEDDKGELVGIQASIGKAGSSVSAWLNALTRMCTLALDQGMSIDHLLEQLTAQGSDRRRFSRDGIQIKSGPEGLAWVLQDYQREKRLRKRYAYSETERPPRLVLRRSS